MCVGVCVCPFCVCVLLFVDRVCVVFSRPVLSLLVSMFVFYVCLVFVCVCVRVHVRLFVCVSVRVCD